MIALKNFHIQFDIVNKTISFYSDDSSILQLASMKGKYSDSDSISTKLIVIISISGTLIIIIIFLLIFRYIRKKNSSEIEKGITKFT